MWRSQDGACAACRIRMTRGGKSSLAVVVDHDHETGRVRGLLHNNCNRAIGLLRDSSELLFHAARYVEMHDNLKEICK